MKRLVCLVFAQCYDDRAHDETVRLTERVSALERKTRHLWSPRDTFGA